MTLEFRYLLVHSITMLWNGSFKLCFSVTKNDEKIHNHNVICLLGFNWISICWYSHDQFIFMLSAYEKCYVDIILFFDLYEYNMRWRINVLSVNAIQNDIFTLTATWAEATCYMYIMLSCYYYVYHDIKAPYLWGTIIGFTSCFRIFRKLVRSTPLILTRIC